MRNGLIHSRVIRSFTEKRPPAEKSARNRVFLRSQIPNRQTLHRQFERSAVFPATMVPNRGTDRFR